MDIIKITLLLLAALLTSSCATGSKDISFDQTKSGVTVSQSEFDANVKYESPKVRAYNRTDLLAWESAHVFLRAVRDNQTGITIFALYIVNTHQGYGWRFYDSVSLVGGERRKLKVLDREVGTCSAGCLHTEQTLFTFKTGEIHKYSLSGLKFRMNGSKTPSNEGAVIEITADYIKGFLSGMQEQISKQSG